MRANGNGNGAATAKGTDRRPRRVVLLIEDSDGRPEQILAEYQGAEVSGNRLHADVQRLAEEYAGRCVAGEWLGPLGWTRFLWRRQGAAEPRP